MTKATADLDTGQLARLGLLAPNAQQRAEGVLQRIDAEGVETVRLVCADQHGVLRGKTIVAKAARSAFKSGITAPSTLLFKDTAQRTAFPVWRKDAGFGRGALTGSGDILLAPDPSTFNILPWSPNSGWMLCDVAQLNGDAIPFASRNVLRTALSRLAEAGLEMRIGLEIEFHIFSVADPKSSPTDAGMPAAAPDVEMITRDFGLLGEARYDAMEEIATEIRRACEALGLAVRGVEAEFGPSQIEFVFEPGPPMAQADAMVLFRSMVKQLCARRGLHATFMCRPRLGSCAASGWHIHQSVAERQTGANIFRPVDGAPSPKASAWIAGLLEHARESCLLTTPTVNGYRRFQAFQLAPNRIQWAEDNRGAMIRALMRDDDPNSRIENRVAEPAANPYYAFASQILSGLSGLSRALTAPAASEEPYSEGAPRLPANMDEAIRAFEGGDLYRSALGDAFVSYYAQLKRAEWDRYIGEISEWEQREYFSLL
ncbi:MAG: glutamine synthetase family protein [Neomegalonema sp.]|nr:glutamine synthetase family protein [Neomegalonema sp.]